MSQTDRNGASTSPTAPPSILTWRGAWGTGVTYVAYDLAYVAGSTYICITGHVSGVFATDLAAGKWAIFAASTGGDLLAANNLNDVANKATSRTNLAVPGLATPNTFTARQNLASFNVAANATSCDIWTGGNVVTLTGGVVTFTNLAAAPQAGVTTRVNLNAAHVFTNNANLTVDGGTWTGAAGSWVDVFALTTTTFKLTPHNADGTAVVSSILRSYLAGLALSTAGASTTMTVAAGQANDSTNVISMTLAASINKTTSAWAVGTGNGGLDTGAIANTTWYHWFLIRRPDTGVTDILVSLSATAPTMPTNYSQFRRIGSWKTNGSAQWETMVQYGNKFLWGTPPAFDFSAAGSTTAASVTLNTPTGVVNEAFGIAVVSSGGGGLGALRISALTQADIAPATITSPLGDIATQTPAVNQFSSGTFSTFTNTSAQVRHRELNTNTVSIQTYGWIDTRGRDA